MVSVEEKAREGLRQVGIKETSASEPLMTCRKTNPVASKPGSVHCPGIGPGGYLLTVQAAPGMEAA